ncbi:hypothetical protein [Janthinobacterium kumbetense]|uniref:Uncharacterized protein n=1 Tax=Janthinobacterium kumbetense TaxID=2950280 RepID=A0ABT0WXI4_9BURK|nr:hypothetical protein [Janthinobacterium kumbetense]MCM2568748.1 hypothetical protein [Janthinobacterium kumbetense]
MLMDTSPQNSEGAVLFRSLLEQIGETETSLAKLMVDMGDDRQDSTILRGLQRISNGQARISGEMKVLMNLVRALRRRVNSVSMQSDWQEEEGSIVGVTADGFKIRISEKAKGRWMASIVHLPSGYCPPFPKWQYSILGAKEAAMRRIDEARSDSEWERADELIFVGISSDESYMLRSWLRGIIDNTPKHIDEENAKQSLKILEDAFSKHGLVLDEEKVGVLSLETIRFTLGPNEGQNGVAVPIAFFKNPPINLKRLSIPKQDA